MSLIRMTVRVFSLCAIPYFTLLIGCGTEAGPITSKSTNYEVGDDSASTPKAVASSDATDSVASPTISDAVPAPTGQVPPSRPNPINQTPADAVDMIKATPEQLLNVIRRLRQQEPNGTNEDEMIADFINLQTQLVQAVDMLLDMKPADEVVIEAAGAKIGALSAASQLGSEGALDQVFAFTEELAKHPSKKVSTFAQQQSFGAMLNAFSTDQTDNPQEVIDAFKKLAAEQPKEGGLLRFGRDVASRFVEKGMNKEAADLLRFTAELVQPTDDPRLKEGAESLVEQAKFAEVDLGAKLNAVAEKKEGAIDEFAAMLGELTSGEKVGPTTLQTLMQIAGMLEGQHEEAAAKVYDVLDISLGKGAEGEVAEIIKDTIDKYRIRSSIVGKPFALEGKLMDGTPFDWAKYKGKVVLVDFWATWCGPCLQEMPNIRANYEKYKDQGFEVVGVNLDDEVDKLKEFNSLQPLPWPSVLSADDESVGWEHPMVAKYGVAAIPFLVLVDQEGTAIALNTRGSALGEKLAELFPESAVDADSTPASDPAPVSNPEPAPSESE